MTDPDRPLLPLTGVQKAMIGIAMVAMGAGGAGTCATELHRGFMDGALSMVAYAFA